MLPPAEPTVVVEPPEPAVPIELPAVESAAQKPLTVMGPNTDKVPYGGFLTNARRTIALRAYG